MKQKSGLVFLEFFWHWFWNLSEPPPAREVSGVWEASVSD